MFKKHILFALFAIPCLSIAQEDFSTTPNPEVIDGVESSRGGSPLLYRQIEEHQREYERYQTYAPKVQKKSRTIPLNPDNLDLPFEIEVSKGYISTITFLDAKGNPFPVRVSRVGNDKAFIVCTGTSADCKITEDDFDIAHILTIGTPYLAGRTNLRVFFKGLYRAVNIPLVVRKDSYHDEVTIMLPIDNPDHDKGAVIQSRNVAPVETDDYIARGMIDGIPANKLGGGIQLSVETQNRVGQVMPNDGSYAIYANGNTYLKTSLTRPNPSATAITHGFMSEVVYRFSGRPRAVSGFDKNGNEIGRAHV